MRSTARLRSSACSLARSLVLRTCTRVGKWQGNCTLNSPLVAHMCTFSHMYVNRLKRRLTRASVGISKRDTPAVVAVAVDVAVATMSRCAEPFPRICRVWLDYFFYVFRIIFGYIKRYICGKGMRKRAHVRVIARCHGCITERLRKFTLTGVYDCRVYHARNRDFRFLQLEIPKLAYAKPHGNLSFSLPLS